MSTLESHHIFWESGSQIWQHGVRWCDSFLRSNVAKVFSLDSLKILKLKWITLHAFQVPVNSQSFWFFSMKRRRAGRLCGWLAQRWAEDRSIELVRAPAESWSVFKWLAESSTDIAGRVGRRIEDSWSLIWCVFYLTSVESTGYTAPGYFTPIRWPLV